MGTVIGAVATAIACFTILGLFFAVSGYLGWPGGGRNEETEPIDKTIIPGIVLMMAICSGMAGMIASLLSPRKRVLHAILTGAVLIMILLLTGNPFLSLPLDMLIIVFFTVAGGSIFRDRPVSKDRPGKSFPEAS